MRALRFDTALRFQSDAPAPTPAADELLIRVLKAGVCATDLEIVRGYMGFRGVPGHEFVGRVESGDRAWKDRRVVCEINCVCGRCELCTAGLASHCGRRTVIGILGRDGAFADYVAVPQRNCHPVPDAISDDEAVFVEPLAAAVQVTRQVPIEPRHRVAVIGSGRLGLLVAQVLKRHKCRLVVVGRNPRTLGMLDRAGITALTAAEMPARREFDVVVECTGSPDGLPLAMKLVRPRGTIVMKTTCGQPFNIDLAPLVIDEITLLGSRCGPFDAAIGLLQRGEVDVLGLVSRTFPLSRGVEAFAAAADPDVVKVLLEPGA